MVRSAYSNRMAILNILRGRNLREASGETYEADRHWLNRDNRKRGLTWEQRFVLEVVVAIGLWEPEGSDEGWATERFPEIQEEVDSAFDATAVSYVLTRPPLLEVIYVNPQTESLYQLRPEHRQGLPILNAALAPGIDERMRNLEPAAHHIALAQGMLNVSEFLGKTEYERTQQLVGPTLAEFTRRYPTLAATGTEPHLVGALYATYTKQIDHWEKKNLVLTYEVRWNYRPEWRLIHVTYRPRGVETENAMYELKRRLQDERRLRTD